MTRNVFVVTCTTAMLALTAGAALAQQTVRGQNDQGRAVEQRRFDDNERRAANSWYDANQRHLPVGFRANERLSPSVELQFQQGYVINPAMRRQMHPVPYALLHQLAPAPRGYRYMAIDEHIVLIDSSYRVSDVIHVGHGR
jgi:Ni/Co efflux regulator RcnB